MWSSQLFTLEMAVASHKRGPRDVVHLLATGNFFFFISALLYFLPTFVWLNVKMFGLLG